LEVFEKYPSPRALGELMRNGMEKVASAFDTFMVITY